MATTRAPQSRRVQSVELARRELVTLRSRWAHWIGALTVAGAFAWVFITAVTEHHLKHWTAGGRMAWSVSLFVAVLFVARGIWLGRPVTVANATVSSAMVATGVAAHLLSLDPLGDALVAGAGVALMWPMRSRRDAAALPRVWELIERTHGDPLAPFAMQSMKSYWFNADSSAVIAYRTRLGFAVVSGDPVGDRTRFADLVGDFAAMCHDHGWRIMVLGCSERHLPLWGDVGVVGQSMKAVPIGRDVVIYIQRFAMIGRRFRNLRQAVQRTHNAGITTHVVEEQQLDASLKTELLEVLYASHRRSRVERGFSMILDRALEGCYPGVLLIIGRDRLGRVQGFHRYATAGAGNDVTLDVPWRRPDAPNGLDERLAVDMVAYCAARGGRRLSLAFAAFPELFEASSRSAVQSFYYTLIHLGDPLIRLESLYRYLRKFHALSHRRYVLLSMRHLPQALALLLWLEFFPRRRRLRETP